jgi:hypothetical protein
MARFDIYDHAEEIRDIVGELIPDGFDESDVIKALKSDKGETALYDILGGTGRPLPRSLKLIPLVKEQQAQIEELQSLLKPVPSLVSNVAVLLSAVHMMAERLAVMDQENAAQYATIAETVSTHERHALLTRDRYEDATVRNLANLVERINLL